MMYVHCLEYKSYLIIGDFDTKDSPQPKGTKDQVRSDPGGWGIH